MAHLNRSEKTKTHRKLVVYGNSHGNWSDLYIVDFDGEDEISIAAKLAHPLNPDCCFIRDGFQVYGSIKFKVYGSCNGLLLLYNNNNNNNSYDDDEVYYRWLLLNPFIRKFQKVIPCPGETSFDRCKTSLFGFGYDSNGNDYKLVRVILFPADYCLDEEIRDVEVWVFSFGSNTWRKKTVPFCPNKILPEYIHEKIGFFLDGALYWLSTEETTTSDDDWDEETTTTHEIVTFDLSKEVFVNLVHSDSLSRSYCRGYLLVIGGSLALLQVLEDLNAVELYLAVKSEDYYVWTKLYNIDPFPGLIITALEVSKNGDKLLLLMDDGKLYWYNLKNNKDNRIRLRVTQYDDDFTGLFCSESVLCWESLVWPATHSSILGRTDTDTTTKSILGSTDTDTATQYDTSKSKSSL
ncbi:hypothetical protein COLO4_14605 [Corchorus olitorius]|uniref:F-box associated beta-propeller type 1 domain-containing protein n=1 Tax=Corchorus olitorius TaxID=93759 RepID=A0A1R3JRP2_9ROSI|nr:hypothetical protein COLO4_14605 [Corchorus olitorius]